MTEKHTEIGVFGCFSGANLGEQATLIAVAANLHLISDKISVRNFATGRFYQGYRAPEMLKGDYESAVEVEIARHKSEGPLGAVRQEPGWRAALKQMPLAVALVVALRRLLAALKSITGELRWLGRSWRQMRGIDLFLITGSNQCFDFFGGPWNFPYTLLKWSALAKLAGAKLAFVSVGAGPVISPLSKRMLRSALTLADYRSFRDQISRDAVSEFCPRFATDPVEPDLAFSLPVDGVADADGGSVIVGINTMAIFDRRYWPNSDDQDYSRLIDSYAELVKWIERAGYGYFFYATNPRDVLVVRDIGIRLGTTRAEFTDPEIFPGSVAGLMRRISRAQAVVALRFHGIVLPYLLGKPTLALEYWGKTEDLARDMGQMEYFVSREDFLVRSEGRGIDVVTAKLESLIRERVRVSRHVCEVVNGKRALLRKQYDNLIIECCPTVSVLGNR